jgi:S-adenosylmethionine:tRNA ribosyltransferase-isomerase
MKTSDFFFDLPGRLIAQYPPEERGKTRLMVLDAAAGTREHRMTEELPEILSGPAFCGKTGQKGKPLLVFNNSRVRKARLPGISLATGGTAEFLLLNRIDPHTWRTMTDRAKRRRPGNRYRFPDGKEGEIVPPPPGTAGGDFRYLYFDSPIDDFWLDIHGHIPLPPYINRDDEGIDCERYQTVYADRNAAEALGPGASVAAPTAGLHFTQELLSALDAAGIEKAFVTLHVGPGTFLPVRSEHIEDHVMHEEVYSIDEDAKKRINGAKAEGRKIVAVGTTSARTLESAALAGEAGICSASKSAGPSAGPSGPKIPGVTEGEGSTSIFIYPGYRFRMVDALFTNFHTPGSTLLMLAAAFAGRDLILKSYAEAVRKGYRFFSYGDAMLLF